ncbi:kinase-like domain-containing protein [Lyophyllum atratum]|nr:kinase-like domain-containing protein [Lyophyllum atratum]
MDEPTESEIQKELKARRDDANIEKRDAIFHSDFMRQWFSSHGYTPYIPVLDRDGCLTTVSQPSLSPNESCDSEFPYAIVRGASEVAGYQFTPPLAAFLGHSGNVFYAQDSQRRHVAIKVVAAGSEEHKIFQFLHELGSPVSHEDFNRVIPVLELLPFGEFWFAVMPRWGDNWAQPIPSSMSEVLEIIRCLLKGLIFLHGHKVAHGDISNGNILVNHFAGFGRDFENPHRIHLRSNGQLTYALFDFDLATKFPETWTLDECRLPYQKSWQGTPGCVPLDTCQGEFDFDPFAWDVGSLGLLLRYHYQHLTPDLPMLAPFLDRLRTRIVSQRFTAAEALRFLEEEVYPLTTREQLLASPRPRPHDEERVDPWEGLDPAFIKQWAAFREPPLPLSTMFMRFICEYTWVRRTVACIRRSTHMTHQFLSAFLHR